MADQHDPDAILKSLRQITRRLSEHSHRLSRTSGLTTPQVLCLKAVAELGDEATVAGVAQCVDMGAPTVSGVLDRLERQELVRRERGIEDRRRVFVRLTPEGRDRIDELPGPLHDGLADRLEALPRDERARIGAVLASVAEMMEQPPTG